MNRALLFDIGNVLLRFDFSTAARRFAELSAVSADEVLTRLAIFKSELESGRISDDEFVSHSTELIGFRGTRDQFAEIWGNIFTENEPMTGLVQRLAGKMPLYLFSNTNGLHKTWFMSRFGVFSHFDGGVFSHEIRHMKPDEGFYRTAIEQFRLDPAQTFYIDDLAENIATGERLGFVTHRYDFRDHAALERDLECWLGKT